MIPGTISPIDTQDSKEPSKLVLPVSSDNADSEDVVGLFLSTNSGSTSPGVVVLTPFKSIENDESGRSLAAEGLLTDNDAE